MAGPGRQPTVSDEDILDVFREATDPVLTTAEVAAELEIGHRGTFDRLDTLVDDGTIQMKKIGETGAVWWYPDALREKFS